MRHFSLLVFFFLFLTSSAQWKTSSPLGATLEDITFVDDYTGFACVQYGPIGGCQYSLNFYKTIDKGENWIKISTESLGQPRALHFLDNKTGWMACSSSEVLKTTDGGMSWTQQEYGVGVGYNDIWFTTPSVGFVTGGNGLLRRSTNGGASWQTISSGTSETLERIYFSSVNVGFITLSNGDILRTNNGGDSWDYVTFATGSVYDFSFLTEQTGFAVGYESGLPRLFSTTDGGQSWSMQLLSSGYNPRLVQFFDENRGVVNTYEGDLLITSDGGANWSITPTLYSSEDSWKGMHFVTQEEGYLCGRGGRIIKTTDGGASWSSQQSSIYGQGRTVAAVHRDTAYFGDINGNLYKTVNGAVNMSQLLANQDDEVVKIIALDEQEVVAAYSNMVLKSSDGGANWEEKYSNDAYAISDMHFATAAVGYISTLDSVFLKTTDAGENWEAIAPDEGDFFRTVWFTDEETGFLASDSKVFKTTNGGQDWTIFSLFSLPISVTGTVKDMVFPSEDVGFLSSSPRIYWTRDGGESWEIRRPTNGFSYNELWFSNDSLGYFTRGSSQGMTSDSCATLSSSATACLANNSSMHGIDMTDGGDYGYSVGGFGGLLNVKEQSMILPPILSVESFCMGTEMFVAYIAKGVSSSNVFEVQLSDPQGDFSSPTVIGTKDMSGNFVYPSSIITCLLPAGLAEGSGYRVRVRNTSNGVLSPDNGVDLAIMSSITPEVSIQSMGTGLPCSGETVEFFASGSGTGLSPTIEWALNGVILDNVNDQFASSDLVEGDQLTVTLTSSLSCASVEMVSSEVYDVVFSPETTVEFVNDSVICFANCLQLEPEFSSPPQSVMWMAADGLNDTTALNPIVCPSSSVQYEMELTDENGCLSQASFSLLVFDSLPAPEITFNGQMLISTEAEGYQWYLDGNVVEGAIQQEFEPFQSGEYSVSVVDENNCEALSENFTVIISAVNELDMIQQWDVRVSNDRRTLTLIWQGQGSPSGEIFVTDVQGRVVYQSRSISSVLVRENKLILDASDWSPGLYLVVNQDETKVLFSSKVMR